MKQIEWTTQRRYQPYEKWDEAYQEQLQKEIANSSWRFHYHIQPFQGLLNDPNGFSYFNKQWHLFYQNFPMGPVHGLKSWRHLTSTDLVHWHDQGFALTPTAPYTSHGVYSGSAIPVDEQLFLMYTGNVRDKDWQRDTYQLGAWMEKNGKITQKDLPLIHLPKGYAEHFRDPQIFKYDNTYYCLIGAQNEKKEGVIALFQSDNLQDWTQLGNLNFTKEKMGYMIECPNLIFINQQAVLIFCPQGLDKTQIPYDNIYPNMYVLGTRFETKTQTITDTTPLHQLDEGFDIYATQAFNAPDGRALAVSWVGLPDLSYPSDNEGWAHCLSLVKELTIKDNHLYQYPVVETKQLRQGKQIAKTENSPCLFEKTNNCYELHMVLPADFCGTLRLFASKNNDDALRIHINGQKHQLTVDRSHCGERFASEYKDTRTASLPHDKIELNIFIDASMFELYINKGRKTMTGRVFPNKENQAIFLEGNHNIAVTCYDMERNIMN